MAQTPCHADANTAVRTAKSIIYDELGLRRVADWCGVSESAIYQWFSRPRAESEPIPPRHVARILSGAGREGVVIDDAARAILWPEMARAA